MRLIPITLAQAQTFVKEHHRHHGTVTGWKWGVGVEHEDVLVGVAIAGRPVARGLDDGFTLEVTRCCTDGTPHACSMLYGAVRRAAKALGYTRLITYTLEDEPGTSLKAAGWVQTATVQGRSWSCPSRPRTDKHPTVDKVRWEAPL